MRCLRRYSLPKNQLQALTKGAPFFFAIAERQETNFFSSLGLCITYAWLLFTALGPGARPITPAEFCGKGCRTSPLVGVGFALMGNCTETYPSRYSVT